MVRGGRGLRVPRLPSIGKVQRSLGSQIQCVRKGASPGLARNSRRGAAKAMQQCSRAGGWQAENKAARGSQSTRRALIRCALRPFRDPASGTDFPVDTLRQSNGVQDVSAASGAETRTRRVAHATTAHGSHVKGNRGVCCVFGQAARACAARGSGERTAQRQARGRCCCSATRPTASS